MSETLLKIEIVTPRNTAYSADAVAVTLPGTLGPFQVLINHAPIISSLDVGVIKIIDHDGNDFYFATNGGFAEIKNNIVSIVVESAEAATEIDYEDAQNQLAAISARIAGQGDHHLSEEEKKELVAAKNRVRIAEAMRD